ncbi:MAG: sulfatase-like hydrolase/transferase, partial [Candidatus Sumerlaeia bacterium]
MPDKMPNILFLMTDQMQNRVLDPGHVCKTPNLDKLMERGVRFQRAYTPNAICSPARASLMTGLLPHNHGVLTVTHVVDDDQSMLRTEHPHWAQHLVDAGYQTGYYGKWHVERTGKLEDFGWQRHNQDIWSGHQKRNQAEYSMEFVLDNPGYNPQRFYGVTNCPPEERGVGLVTQRAIDYLDDVMGGDAPWCCFASVIEPHDPFICGEEAFSLYDVDQIEVSPSLHDEMADRPGIYRKAGRVWSHLTEAQHREAAACYFASITEIDQQFGKLIDKVMQGPDADNTIIVFTTDHGEHLGAHGLYCKNFCADEEVYSIPLIMAGPGIAKGKVSRARVGLHDLCPTLMELTGCKPIENPDSRPFTDAAADPEAKDADYDIGFAEYHGGRMNVTQRIVWQGDWKYVFNGFDFDELYNLADDPYEMQNRAEEPAQQDRVKEMCKILWRTIRETGDHSVLNSHYPILRVAPFGPKILEEDKPG